MMHQPLWRASARPEPLDGAAWPSCVSVAQISAVIEAICSDALLDGFSDISVSRIVAMTGMRPEHIDLVIDELVARGLMHVRFVNSRSKRIFEPGRALRAVYRLGA